MISAFKAYNRPNERPQSLAQSAGPASSRMKGIGVVFSSALFQPIALSALLLILEPFVHFRVQNRQYPRVAKGLCVGRIFRNNRPLPEYRFVLVGA
jgi:hypothetical protein